MNRWNYSLMMNHSTYCEIISLRFAIKLILLATVAMHTVSGIAQSGEASAERVNVVLLVADDLRADVMSVYGGPVATPNLEKLAARGCLFTRASCGYPICHVSRTEIVTGRSLVAEASSGKTIAFDPTWTTWPACMRQAGWHTVYSGKWHVQGTPNSRGYSATSALYSGGGSAGKPLSFPRTPTGLAVTGYTGWTFKGADDKPLLEHGIGLTPTTDAIITQGAVAAINHRSNRPLFLHVNFTAPHDPLFWPSGMENSYSAQSITLPENFRDSHPFDHGNIVGRDEIVVPAPRSRAAVQAERAIYYGLVANLDKQVGMILETIDRNGGQWLIIFTSDQGLSLGSHGLMGKQNQYEHTANPPLIIAGKGIPTNRRLNTNCALRDLYPTCCELAGVPIPHSVQGKSLQRLINGHASQVHPFVYGYFTDTQRMIRSEDGWKLIWYPKVARTQLFHTPSDPWELNDLSQDSAHVRRKQDLARALNTWLQLQGDSAPRLKL